MMLKGRMGPKGEENSNWEETGYDEKLENNNLMFV